MEGTRDDKLKGGTVFGIRFLIYNHNLSLSRPLLNLHIISYGYSSSNNCDKLYMYDIGWIHVGCVQRTINDEMRSNCLRVLLRSFDINFLFYSLLLLSPGIPDHQYFHVTSSSRHNIAISPIQLARGPTDEEIPT